MNSASVPVIITDSTRNHVIEYGMLDPIKARDTLYIQKTLEHMASDNEPIEIELANQGKRVYILPEFRLPHTDDVFSLHSAWESLLCSCSLLTSFSVQRVNRNKTRFGSDLPKKLHTSLEHLYHHDCLDRTAQDGRKTTETVVELNKDIERPQKITDRFSKIGSEPKLKMENIVTVDSR